MSKYFLEEDQEILRSAARDFAVNEVLPVTRELDQKHEFPHKLVKRCAELGFLGVSIPEEWGGAGADCVSECIVIEEIAKVNGSLALIIDAHTSLGCMPIFHKGNEYQKKKYLTPAAKGDTLMSFGLTEPGAGSDAGGTKTTAVLDGDHYVINGSKCWITNIGVAKTYIITAKTDPAAKGSRGISAFIVEAGTPGFEVGAPERKMGLNSSLTGELFFNNCRVPKENLLGELNEGFKAFMLGLDEGRIAISAMAVGMAQGALDLALAYAKERQQFGRPIISFQGVSFKLAEMQAAVDVARTYLYRVAKMRDEGMKYTQEAAILKMTASEMCVNVVDKALQIHGGNGYSAEFDIERFYRDAKLLMIGEGTSEICRVVIGNAMQT